MINIQTRLSEIREGFLNLIKHKSKFEKERTDTIVITEIREIVYNFSPNVSSFRLIWTQKRFGFSEIRETILRLGFLLSKFERL